MTYAMVMLTLGQILDLEVQQHIHVTLDFDWLEEVRGNVRLMETGQEGNRFVSVSNHV